MALVLADRVQETTVTSGTGTITLAGAVTGFQSFSVIGNGNTTYYTLVSGSNWESGIGTYSTTGPTLARTTILASSNAGSAITLSGTSNVFVTYPSGRSINLDATGNLAQAVTAGLGTGRLPVEQFYRLDSAFAGANSSTAQPVFGVGVTLAGSTVYQFEASYALSKTVGATSHSFAVGFGGTATVNNIAFQINGQYNGTGFTTVTSVVGNLQQTFIQTASSTVLQTGITTTGYIMFMVKGTVSIGTGGTFIPQYTLSAAPGGAYSTAAGCYFKISPLGASGANVNIGTWA